MKKEKLSDIEIKLINSTREFAKRNAQLCSTDFYEVNFRNIHADNQDSVVIDFRFNKYNGDKPISASYHNGAEEEKIYIRVNKEFAGSKELLNKYINFLKHEIPEIKDRIEVKD